MTAYDGRPAAELDASVRQAAARRGRRGAPVRLLAGPAVDPAEALAGAAARGDLAVDQPRLPDDRAAPAGGARRHGRGPPRRRPVPRRALVSEADLFLRLCPAPTVGVTGTKGKTTTSALTAAILAADPAHPVELGGNIGRPLVDLLPTLTPDHRVVIELSELQLPTLSRGTTVAVYTNVTSDHLDRTDRSRRTGGSSAAWPSSSTRTARSSSTPTIRSSPATPTHRARARSSTGSGRRRPAASASSTAGSSRTASRACRSTGGGPAAAGTERPDPAGRRAGHPGPPQRRERDGGRRRRPPVRRSRRTRSAGPRRPSPASSTASRPSRPSTASASSTTRMGTQPDAVDRRPARLRAADRPHRRRPRQGRRPVAPWRRSSPSGRPRRSSSARAARPWSGCSGPPAWRRTERAATLEEAVGRADAIAREPRGRTDAGPDRPAEPGRRVLRHVRGLRGPRSRVQGGRGGPRRPSSRQPADREADAMTAIARASPASRQSRTNTLKRERTSPTT